MKKNTRLKSFLGISLAGLIVMSGTAFADDFFYFKNAGNDVAWNGIYVNPYTAVDKSEVNGPDLTIYCDDWNTDFSGNPYWYASVTALTDVQANNTLLSNLKYGSTTPNWNVKLNGTMLETNGQSNNPSPLNRYLEAAWLDNQWRTGAYGTSQDTEIELAAAVWLLFANDNAPTYHLDNLIGAINGSNYADAVFTYLQAAQTNAPNWNASGWSVITPDTSYFAGTAGQTINGTGMQEFLVYSTPEPSAVILLGTVIGYLGLTKFRRRRQA
jgi:hypothetical protein